MKTRALFVTIAVTLGATAAFAGDGFATVGVRNKPKRKKLADRDRAMDGVWQVTTKGTWGKLQKPAAFTRKNMTIKYNGAERKFSGKPFGWPITKSKLTTAKPGSRVGFTTYYSMGKRRYSIEWTGKLSESGTKMDGKFSCKVAKGTFTAEKQLKTAAELNSESIPNGGIGFIGTVSGQIIEKGVGGVIFEVDRIRKTEKQSKASNARALAGKELLLTTNDKLFARHKDLLQQLKDLLAAAPMKEELEFKVGVDQNNMFLVGLTEDQQEELGRKK